MTVISEQVNTGPFPLVYDWMTNEEYHQTHGLSKSGMSRILECPAAYYWEYILGNRKKDTKATDIGAAFHPLVLEPEKVQKQYIVSPKFDGRTTAGRVAKTSFESQAAGRKIIDEEQYELICAMRDSVLSHPSARHLIGMHGYAEESFFWREEITGAGVLCKCRPDKRIPGKRILVDLKSTRSAAPAAFAKDIFNFGYHIQAGHYLDGVSITLGEKYDEFIFIAVEKEPPFLVGVYVLDRDDIEMGRRDAETAIRIYAKCMQGNYWPGYGDEIQPISLPRWAKEREVAIYD